MEDDGPPGVPEWVVTYGDMMSLLLTFFIMLVSLSEIVAEQKYRAVLTALDKKLGFVTAPVSPPGRNFAANSPLELDNDVTGSQSPEEEAEGGLKTRAVKGDDRRIKVTDEGTPEQVGSFLTFIPRTGSLTGESEDALRRIAAELRGKPNKIEIRSHVGPESDISGKTPPPGETLSPVEAIKQSYQQGHTVFRLLTKWGIDPARVRITAAGTAMADQIGGETPAERIEVFTTDVFTSTYVGRRR